MKVLFSHPGVLKLEAASLPSLTSLIWRPIQSEKLGPGKKVEIFLLPREHNRKIKTGSVMTSELYLDGVQCKVNVTRLGTSACCSYSEYQLGDHKCTKI